MLLFNNPIVFFNNLYSLFHYPIELLYLSADNSLIFLLLPDDRPDILVLWFPEGVDACVFHFDMN